MGVRRQIAWHIGYPMQDWIKGTSILKCRKDLLESQHWSSEKIQDLQLQKLQRLVKHAYERIPYYSRAFDSVKFKPSDLKRLEDIERIPILTKKIALNEGENLIDKTFNMKYVTGGKTGGTTGTPLRTYKDSMTRSMTWGSYYRWYEWMGIELGDPVLTLWGAKTVLDQSLKTSFKNKFVNFVQNTNQINSFNLKEENLSKVIDTIRGRKPKLLKGYLSALIQIANYVNTTSTNLGFDLKAISSTTETLLPPYRKLLEETFGCPVYDQYGCGECEAIAYECAEHQGLHVTSEHVYLEILDDKNTQLKDGSGRVVVTDLDNYVNPYIRYENGDSAVISSEECSCGVNQPLLKSISGRSIDTVILNDGSKVHGVFFTDILHELEVKGFNKPAEAFRFQVYQDAPGEIEFRLEGSSALFPVDFLELLSSALNRFFSKANIIIMDELQEDSSGKFRYVISNLNL